MYPEFVRELEVESGTKVDLRDHGTILFPSPEHAKRDAEFVSTHPLPAPLIELEPEMMPPNGIALYLNERSVDPRALSAAAIRAARHRGVDLSSGDEVTAVTVAGGSAKGVSTTKTVFAAPKVINCAGAWSGAIAPYPFPARPVKGQMLCLVMPSHDLLKHVVRTAKIYLIPRSDSRLLVGATVEEAGFDKRTVPSTIQRQYKAALEVLPMLREAKILEDWAGLRPGTPDNLPILGATETPGYFVATGHFRDGILLAPITAEVMADVIEGRQPAHDLSPFSPARF